MRGKERGIRSAVRRVDDVGIKDARPFVRTC